jgi:hypothetical protein
MGKTEKMERMARAKEACQMFWAEVKVEREANEEIELIEAIKSIRDKNQEQSRKYFDGEFDIKFAEYYSIADTDNKRIRYEAVVSVFLDKTFVMKVMLSDGVDGANDMKMDFRAGVTNEVVLFFYILAALNGEAPSKEKLRAKLHNFPSRG